MVTTDEVYTYTQEQAYDKFRELFPELARSITRLQKTGYNLTLTPKKTKSELLLSALAWDRTPQGHTFWYKKYGAYRAAERAAEEALANEADLR